MFIYRDRFGTHRCQDFPDVRHADRYGLLAYGGEYTAECFIRAYRRGIFPWPNDETDEMGVIPWFSPRERFVLFPSELHLSHSLKQTLKKHIFHICADRDFETVIRHCADVPRNDHGTWITEGMIETFCELHRLGFAHSVECYRDETLVGGFYGTCFGRIFGGESMFMLESNAAKVALAVFVQRAEKFAIPLIDCQCYTDNLARYGAKSITRAEYLEIFNKMLEQPLESEFWQGDWY